MKSVKQVDGRFWRKSIDSEDFWAQTVDGTKTLKQFTCKTCKKKGYYSEAYLDAKRKDKIRPYHASCWNQYNGKTFSSLLGSSEPTATLEFLL
jgi:hypothetical protein